MPISKSIPRLHGYIAAGLNNHSGNRIVEHGSQIIVQRATLPQDGPSGRLFNDAGTVAW